MKKLYSNPKVKVISLCDEALLQSSPFPNKLNFDPSNASGEDEGYAE